MLFVVSDDLRGEEVFVSQEVPLKEVSAIDEVNVLSTATTTTATIDDITLAKALIVIKSEKPKATAASTKPRLKGLNLPSSYKLNMKKKKKKKKGLPRKNLNRLKKLQGEKQEELTDKEKARLFMQLLEKRRKFFAAKRVEEKRNMPPTRAQQRSIMCTYLKNVEGWKLNSLKNKLQGEKQEELTDKEKARLFMQLLEKRRKFFAAKRVEEKRNMPPTRAQQRSIMSMKKVNTFVDYKSELVEKSSKKAKAEVLEESSNRARTELEQESFKKQKIDDDKETTKLKQEDIETLWILVKSKHRITRPEEGYERVLWVDLKVMFDPYVEDEVWKMQQRYNVVCVTAAKQNLVLFSHLNEKYARVKLVLLVKIEENTISSYYCLYTVNATDNDIQGVSLMTTPVVYALVDFLVGSLSEIDTVVSLGEAGFLNFHAFLGGVTPVA
nr:hypothetical protein [Tanacetum cinerariifolium]